MVQAFAGRRSAPAHQRFTIRRTLIAFGLTAAVIAPAGAGSILPQAPTLLTIPTHQASPAMWEVRDGDTTIFLFGTFHTLDARTRWFDRSVRSAFDRSGELVLETIVPDDPSVVRALGRKSIGDSGKPAGSFFASTKAVIARGRANGLSVELGADAVLKRAAADQGKTLAGLERFEDQLSQFARIPATAPTLIPAPATGVPMTLNDLLVAWKSGDTGAFSTMLAGFEAKAPAAYRILIADRNARYGEWIVNRLDQPGTVFVAVGSGHLAGKDSVQNWLSSKGILARRVN